MVYNRENDLRPRPLSPTYPPYHRGLYLEEYFFRFFENLEAKPDRIYIDVFWTNIFCNHQFCNLKYPDIQTHLNSNLKKDGKYFTVCQFDDGPLESFPDDTLIFSAGGNRKRGKLIPIPLVCAPIPKTLIPQNEKRFLASFVGANTHPVRAEMYSACRDKKGFKMHGRKWNPDVSGSDLRNFLNITTSSKFCLCPRGYGTTSFRLYEAMQLDTVPVYISDHHSLPWSDEIDWTEFCVIVDRDRIDILEDILNSIPQDRYNYMLLKAKQIYQQYFSLDGVCRNILKRLTLGSAELSAESTQRAAQLGAGPPMSSDPGHVARGDGLEVAGASDLPVLLWLTNYGASEITANSIASVRRTGFADAYTKIVGYSDERARSMLEACDLGVHLIALGEVMDCATEELGLPIDYSEFGTQAFKVFNIFRYILIASVLAKARRRTIYSDGDIVFLRDPASYLDVEPGLHHGCVLAQNDRNAEDCDEPERIQPRPGQFAARSSICSGFTIWQPLPEHYEIARTIVREISNTRPIPHDQPVFNRLPQAMRHRVQLLPEDKFVNGSWYFGDSAAARSARETLDPIIVHANWMVGIETKIRALKAAGLWYL